MGQAGGDGEEMTVDEFVAKYAELRGIESEIREKFPRGWDILHEDRSRCGYEIGGRYLGFGCGERVKVLCEVSVEAKRMFLCEGCATKYLKTCDLAKTI